MKLYKLPEQKVHGTYSFVSYCAYTNPQHKLSKYKIDRQEISPHEYINVDKIVRVKLLERSTSQGEYQVESMKVYLLKILLEGDVNYVYSEYSTAGIPEKFMKIIDDLVKLGAK